MNPIDIMENMDGMLDKFAPSSSSSRSTGAGASGILKMIKPIPSEYVQADAPEMNKDKLGDDSGDEDEEDNLSDKIFDVDDTSSSVSAINPDKKKKKEDVMDDVMGEINNIVEKAVRAKTAEKTAQKTAQMEPDDGQLEQK